MTDDPVNLDARRTAATRLEVEIRRRSANGSPTHAVRGQRRLEGFHDQMIEEAAQTWGSVMEKWRFLLERYSATSDADDDTKKLIRRAIDDLERMKKSEERS